MSLLAPRTLDEILSVADQLEGPEHPNPAFRRDEWLDLCGTWEFQPDPDDRGRTDGWAAAVAWATVIRVPYAPETTASGIADPHLPAVFWYRRPFRVPDGWRDRRIWLHFGAVDYACQVFVNGRLVGSHEGGYTPFALDITDALGPAGDQDVVLRVEDPPSERAQPRGKQTTEANPQGIFYTRTSGIWQPVWLEPTPRIALQSVRITPEVAAHAAWVEVEVNRAPDRPATVTASVTLAGAPVAEGSGTLTGARWAVRIKVPPDHASMHAWTPDAPHLYDVNVRLRVEGEPDDLVHSYFGLRSIATTDGRLVLNGEPLYLRMVLDQGYFPQTGLTAPDDTAFRRDILLVKAMGFNGVRKHQKIEDPRFLYWCDRLGLLVWEEMPAAYEFTPQAVVRTLREWPEVILRDYNHPSIIAWVPLNESWGVPRLAVDAAQQAYAKALFQLTKSLDGGRLCIANDGWEHTATDVLTVHDYTQDPRVLRERYRTRTNILAFRPGDRPLWLSATDASHRVPVLVTEWGGIALASAAPQGGWGYGTVASADGFLAAYRALVRALKASDEVQGFCYTQLTDVEQEQNGLLTMDRKPKVSIAEIRRATMGHADPDADG